MDWRTLFSGDYLAAVEFGDRTLTARIAGVQVVGLEDEKGEIKQKAVVSFADHPRKLVLCKTNGFCLAAMFGDDYTQWIGKPVTMYATRVKVGHELKPGIRIKGSPDLERPVKVTIKLRKRKAFDVTLVNTGSQKQPQDTPEAASIPSATGPEEGPPESES